MAHPRTNERITCGNPACGKLVTLDTKRRPGYDRTGEAFCNRACRMATVGRQVACTCANPECGKQFTKHAADVERSTTGQFFCSRGCAGKRGSKPRTGSNKPCATCGEPVYRAPNLDDGGPRYCNSECFGRSLEGERVEREIRICIGCDQPFRLTPDQKVHDVKACSPACAGLARRRKPGERYVGPDGYAWVTTPDGRSILEHRWVMEQHLGRPLTPDETVHHKTGGHAGRSNNALSNLELWTGRHPKGHRVEDVVAYAREVLALYGHLVPAGAPPIPELDDPEWLATEYRTNGRSAADIAEGLGCSRKRVRTALARHDIRVRRRRAGRAFPELGDADWLRDQFVTKNRTRSEIAADVGCATMSVTRALRAAGLVP
jgi:hypothetical protein